jgi:serine phosphatase RsbU (regulator of sigma subunit)
VQYLVLDMSQQQINFICAGHPPILLCHANGRIEQLGQLSNIPLGIDATFTYRQEVRRLCPGDRLLLYSDGAYELRDGQGAMFGLARLADLFAAAPPEPENTICTLQEALDAFGDIHSPHDDTTLLCAHIVEG